MFPPNGWDEHWKDEKIQSINKFHSLKKKYAARKKKRRFFWMGIS